MSQFLGNIVSRHLGAVENVLPRLPGRFESADPFPDGEAAAFPVPTQPSVAIAGHEGVRVAALRAQTPEWMGKQGLEAIPVASTGIQTVQAVPEKTPHTRIGEGGLTGPEISVERAGLPSNPTPHEQPWEHKLFFQPPDREEPKSFELRDDTQEWVDMRQTQSSPGLPLPNHDGTPFLGPRNPSEKPFQTSPLPLNPVNNERDLPGALGEPPGIGPVSGITGHPMQTIFRPETPSAPVIKVTIGQIHVRALNPPPPVAANRPKQAHKPMLTLEDYLKGRG